MVVWAAALWLSKRVAEYEYELAKRSEMRVFPSSGKTTEHPS
jgi:hypothetical protein